MNKILSFEIQESFDATEVFNEALSLMEDMLAQQPWVEGIYDQGWKEV